MPGYLWQNPAPPPELGPGFWPSPVLERLDLTESEPLAEQPYDAPTAAEDFAMHCATRRRASRAVRLLRALYLALCGVACLAVGAGWAWLLMRGMGR